MLSDKSSKDLEASLNNLYQTNREAAGLDLVARYSPIIRLDDEEPFEPLAAGYTIFRDDSPSPSFARLLRLNKGSRRANFIIEYAIWWDWDINHLYELEHIWVLVNHHGQVVGVEGSWHGDVKDLGKGDRLKLQGEHPIVTAAPGKHAFALSIKEFQKHQGKIPGLTTRFAGASGIAVNGLFAGQIRRTPVWDRLIHSYLACHAFRPSWRFARLWSFKKRSLVPWPTLREWIPGRVNTWLAHLEVDIGLGRYRTLRTVACSTRNEIRQAGKLGMDMVQLSIGRNRLGLPVVIDETGKPTGTNLLSALRTCAQARIGAYLVLLDDRVIPWVGRILAREDWSDYMMTGTTNPAWVAAIKSRLPHYRTLLIVNEPTDQAVTAALAVGASYIHLNDAGERHIKQAWIRQAHQAELGIVCGPVSEMASFEKLKSMGIEAIIVKEPFLIK